MAIVTATIGHPRTEECIASWGDQVVVKRESSTDRSMLQKYQDAYESSDADVLAYLHDDLLIREPGWTDRVLAEFRNCDLCGYPEPCVCNCFSNTVGLVGFGGALRHGAPDLYRTRYNLRQLARYEYFSNQSDAEIHGKRFTGNREVAVLDGFALIVRRKLLDLCGGWPIDKFNFHCYDYYMCGMAHRYRYKIKMVGISCTHFGGLTSVGLKADDGQNHVRAHRVIAEEFRDVLPWACT